jgi:hypothetical protein
MISQISTQVRGPLATTAYEVGRDSSKSFNRVRVCMSCIRVENLPCLRGGSPDYKSGNLQSIRGIEFIG